jgi:hypothetical protein
MDYKAQAIDRVVAAAAGGTEGQATVYAPRFSGDFECMGPDGLRWKDRFENVVVNVGKAQIVNRLFGSGTASSVGAFLWLHSATTASNHAWPDISASRLTAFGNDVPRATIATGTAASASGTCSYAFYSSVTTANQTCSGAAVIFYTAATMSTNAATGDMLEYSEGHFAASRLIQPQDTLNVTLTVSYA